MKPLPVLALFTTLFVSVFTAFAQPTRPLLHPLFADHAVLQRDKPSKIWGFAAPKAPVEVSLAGSGKSLKVTIVADENGRWQNQFPAFEAGGPFEIQVKSGNETTLAKDVLFGDVWLCGGQSNMAFPVGSSTGGKDGGEANANLRLFNVPKVSDIAPHTVPDASWKPATQPISKGYSAVGYYFGAVLQKELNVPIGLIGASYDGSSIEAWMSAQTGAKWPQFAKTVDEVRGPNGEDLIAKARLESENWFAANDAGTRENWQNPDFSDANWKTVTLPATNLNNAELKAFKGISWLRRTVELGADWDGQSARLGLLGIGDREAVWVNGTRVDTLNLANPIGNNRVPAGVLKGGINVVAVRKLGAGDWSFRGSSSNVDLKRDSDGAQVTLAGKWKLGLSAPSEGLPPAPVLPKVRRQGLPFGPFNGMIAPLEGAPIKGVIWYQGETTTGAPINYRKQYLPALIADWRARFGDENLPFGIVQLPNQGTPSTNPTGGAWAQWREAQAGVVKEVPNTFLAVTIDVGEEDLHPRDKKPVGERLAKRALSAVYGAKEPNTGPVFQQMKIEGGFAYLTFTSTAGGLQMRPLEGRASGFALAGTDKKWFHADAQFHGDTVTLVSPDVQFPVAVRYAWNGNPPAPLYGGDGLPAAPFRTDEW